MDLKYYVYRPNNSVIAEPNNLPEQILFCVVDTALSVSTLLLQLDKKPENEFEVKEFIKKIALQENEKYESELHYSMGKSSYVNRRAWRFNVDLKMKNNNDTIPVIYSGFIFKDLAIVSTCNANTMKSEDLIPYLCGLKPSVY